MKPTLVPPPEPSSVPPPEPSSVPPLLAPGGLSRELSRIVRHGVKRGAAVALVMLGLLAMISTAGWLIVPQALEQARAIVTGEAGVEEPDD